MRTLEKAIIDLEDEICGTYHEEFPNSELRENIKENIEFVKFNLETLLKAKKEEIKQTAIDNVLKMVLDDHRIPEHWGFKNWFEYAKDRARLNNNCYIEDALECCEDIIARLAEEESVDNTMPVKELNEKYKDKILYFNGDEDGSQYVYVENIHKGKDEFEVDGVMIDIDYQDSNISVRHIENHKFSRLHYFDKCETTDELDEALMSTPCDTSMPNHIIKPEDVFNDVIGMFRWWFVEEWETKVPALGKVFAKYHKEKYK